MTRNQEVGSGLAGQRSGRAKVAAELAQPESGRPQAARYGKAAKRLEFDCQGCGGEKIGPAGAAAGTEPTAKPKDDPLAKLAERALKQTERSKLGEWLRDSPAWKQAFEDLRGSINDPKSPRWNLEGWQAKLLDPDGDAWRLGAKSLEHLRNLPKPDLERFSWNFSPPFMGEIPAPNFGAPSFSRLYPSARRRRGFSSFSCACWSAGSSCAGQGQEANGRKRVRTSVRGPVRPEAVATRTDLVRAFDYLALCTLGLAVASWNHHAVAGRWREKLPTCAEAAQALALLYEQARYTVGANILSEGERDLARRSLLQIAEALLMRRLMLGILLASLATAASAHAQPAKDPHHLFRRGGGLLPNPPSRGLEADPFA